MPIGKIAIEGLLKTVGWLHPEYSGLIGFLLNHEDELEAAGPVIQEAAKEGPNALAAAEKAAPDLAKAIKDFVAASPVGSPVKSIASLHAENVTRQIVGAPKLTVRQEQEWIDRATPNPNIG